MALFLAERERALKSVLKESYLTSVVKESSNYVVCSKKKAGCQHGGLCFRFIRKAGCQNRRRREQSET